MHRVAVVGGGFTGVCFAAHLLRAARRPLRVDVVEPREALGGGLAYGSAAPEHRINVPVDRMDVYREDPLHFTRWLHATGEWQADPDALTPWGHHYARRDVFGRYMAAVLDEALAAAPPGSQVHHQRRRAVGIARDGTGWRLALEPLPQRGPAACADGVADDGPDVLHCDAVGVTTSHAPPDFPWPVRGAPVCKPGDPASDPSSDPARHAAGGPWLVANAWDLAAVRSIPPDARVLIAGTGLTMADVVVSLRTQGHTGPITAISRRALVPRLQTGRFDLLPLDDGDGCPTTARGLLQRVRQRVAQAEARGLEWRAALDGLRRALPAVWSGMPVAEQRRAVRWLRPFWDVHRFRMAPQVGHLLDAGRRDGWLRIDSGRIVAIEHTAGAFVVSAVHRGTLRTLPCDAFVNCTGPDARFDRTTNPLLRSLLDQRLVVADAHRMGPAVDPGGCAIGGDGAPEPRIRVAGPLTKGTVAEVVGVPEASASARVAAEGLVRWLERDAETPASTCTSTLNANPAPTALPADMP